MPTIFVTNKGGHDYSDAERFGTLQYLSEGPVSKFAVDKIYREFATKLRNSSDEDFILVTGLTVMNCIACSCFSFLHGRLNLLVFKDGKYIVRKLVLSNLLTTPDIQKEQVEEMYKEG